MSDQDSHKIFDEAMFEQLFKTQFIKLCNYAVQFVYDMDTAKDITQKVFINLWEKRENINPQKSIQSYLFTSVRNRCFNYIRDNKKYHSEVLDFETVDIDHITDIDNISLKELEDKIDGILSTLPEKCRIAFEMSRFKGMKYKDIAEELGVSVKTVEAHISKALKSLREQLKGYELLLFILMELFYKNI
ncbi:MAG TPA: RNA polymerase sigma-70 factor [Bacteroidetes bacterium]|nr:RNA polymerase sigma-70 factor [Bacteroidota bacterium]